MKNKVIFVLASCMTLVTSAQMQWSLNLNPIGVGQFPNFGTQTNDPVNFFTNNTKQMILTTNGRLKLVNMIGGGNRIMYVDTCGQLQSSNSAYFSNGKIGLGLSAPVTTLDVVGNARFSDNLMTGGSLILGASGAYARISYQPTVSAGNPAILRFGSGSSSVPYYNGGTGEDPSPDYECLIGPPNPSALVNLFNDYLIVRSQINSSAVGYFSAGHDGSNGYIETKGTNPSNPGAGDLLINNRCNRNVYVFSNGSSFSPGVNNIMSIAGRLNVTQNVQIGGGTSLTSFVQQNSLLYLNANASPIGLRIFHAGGIQSGIKVIEAVATDRAFAIHNGTSTNDGPERFSIAGDGNTSITTTNSDAFSVSDATTGQKNFLVTKNGEAFFGGGITGIPNAQMVIAMPIPNYKALNIVNNSNLANISDLINVYGDGKTEIHSANQKALTIYNSLSNNEVYRVENNGYTEISVYSPLGMPNPYTSTGRAFTIRDKTNNKDIFAVRSDGKMYAREIEINLISSFPDYVFSSSYNLLPIYELKQYIETKKHLPGFENACFYEKNGININSIIVKQQEKIEELVLYIIELSERINKLETQKK